MRQTREVIRRLVREHPLLESLSEPERRFGVMHTHLGLIRVLSFTVASVCFGFFYLRHRNLIGVTIVHSITGVAGR